MSKMVTASFWVTAYHLTLGAYDATTGVPARQFTPTVASIVIGTKGSAINTDFGMYYPKTQALGITDNTNLDEGDYLMDAYSATDVNYWLVLARRPIVIGNVFVAYELDLAQTPSIPFFGSLSHDPVSINGGFEWITEDVEGFETGFERIIITI